MQVTTDNVITIVSSIISAIIGSLSALATLSFRFGKLVEKIDQLEKQNNPAKVAALASRIAHIEGKLEHTIENYVNRASPLTLTHDGMELLVKSGAQEYIDENKDVLIRAIKRKNPKSTYDVQEYAADVIESKKKTNAFTPLKDYIFKEGIPMDILSTTMSIYLRDLALEELDFDVGELDITLTHKKISEIEREQNRERSRKGNRDKKEKEN